MIQYYKGGERLDRVILHCDCNSFFASCEANENPKLKNVPMAVGGNPKLRHGIILAANTLAKARGVITAETLSSALSKCPDLVIVPPRHELYEDYSRRVNDIYKDYTDLVEKFGIDESWLDVTASLNLFGSPKEIADKIRERVKKEIGITISVGVSFNKVFAKLGSDLKKPDATTMLLRDEYKEKIYPLPASSLLYVGKSAEKALGDVGIHTIGDIAQADESLLIRRLGKQGAMLHRYALGNDDEPVSSCFLEKKVKSVGNGTTFPHDLVSEEEIKSAIYYLSESVSIRLREKNQRGQTLQLMIRDSDFLTISRQKKIPLTNALHVIASEAIDLFWNNWTHGKPVRMLTVTVTNLSGEDDDFQLSLFDETSDTKKHESVDKALFSIREKFGKESVLRASNLRNKKDH